MMDCSEKKWQEEIEKLRNIILECHLTEETKWGKPCFTFENSNIAIIIGFKEYCAILFFKGALLSDASNILIKPGENSQSGRQIRFTSVEQIIEMESIVKAYLGEAIDVEKSGLKVNYQASKELKFPEEVLKIFADNPVLKNAFEQLTPGRQRAYNLYFSAPKLSKTREARVEKCTPQILSGQGLNDR